MNKPINGGAASNPDPRQSPRIGLEAEIRLRRAGQRSYRVNILNVSLHGCKAEFVERPQLDELVWVKFESLAALEAMVCWVRGFEVGLEFEHPIHPAVFDVLISRLTQ